MSFYIASSKAFYTISVSSKTANNSAAENFLYSVKIDDQSLIKRDVQPTTKEEAKIPIASLKTTPAIIAALNKKDAGKTELNYDLDDKVLPEDTTKYSRPLITLRKPRASYTDAAREGNVHGIIKLKILFRASGEVGDITVLSKFDKGLIKSAADAVRRIKFLPAEVGGKAVDVSRIVEYSFNIY